MPAPKHTRTYYIDTIAIDPHDAQEWRDVASEILGREHEALVCKGVPKHKAIPRLVRLESEVFRSPRDEAAAAVVADEEFVRFCDKHALDPCKRLVAGLVTVHRTHLKMRQKH